MVSHPLEDGSEAGRSSLGRGLVDAYSKPWFGCGMTGVGFVAHVPLTVAGVVMALLGGALAYWLIGLSPTDDELERRGKRHRREKERAEREVDDRHQRS